MGGKIEVDDSVRETETEKRQTDREKTELKHNPAPPPPVLPTAPVFYHARYEEEEEVEEGRTTLFLSAK